MDEAARSVDTEEERNRASAKRIAEEWSKVDDEDIDALSRAAIEEMGLDRWPISSRSNVYADIEIPDPEVHQLKSALIVELNELIRAGRVARDSAAHALGTEGSEFERALRGDHRHVPLEPIVRALAALGYRVRPRVLTMPPREEDDGLGEGEA